MFIGYVTATSSPLLCWLCGVLILHANGNKYRSNERRTVKAELEIVTQRAQAPNGRWFLQFTPHFTPDACANGSLSFACWQVWEDEPETHVAAINAAGANARRVLAQYGLELMIDAGALGYTRCVGKEIAA